MEYLASGAVVENRYEVVDILGKGAFGAVYRVKDRSVTGKEWALKELIGNYDSGEERASALATFEQEAKILATLNNECLPDITDYFISNDRAYLVMELIPGENLDAYLERKTLPLKDNEIIDLALNISDILDYLHHHEPPVIFRDLKPENIMIDTTGKLYLIDFGIARLFEREKLTDTLHFGTVGYAPPEQYGDAGGTDTRSDLYSLGALLHYLATGRDPVTQAPFHFPPPSELNKAISPGLSGVILKLLEYKREDRYQDVQEVREDLKKIQQGSIPDITLAQKEKLITADTGKKPGRKTALAVLTGLLLIACIFLVKTYYKDVSAWLRESKYYADGKNYLEVVSMEPPSGMPVDPAEVKNVVITFNHPIKRSSMKSGFQNMYGFPLGGDRNITFSSDNTVMYVPLPPKEFEILNEYFVIKPSLCDTRGNRINKSGHYTFRNANPPDNSFGLYDLGILKSYYDYHYDERPQTFLKQFGKKSWVDDIVLNIGFEEPFHRYPLLIQMPEPLYDNMPFPPLTFHAMGNQTWSSGNLAGKNTLFIIQTADGFVAPPDSMDIARIIRKFYAPADLRIIVVYISVDPDQVAYQQKQAGKNILVLSDFQGYRGILHTYLVHSPSMLPLTFFIDKEGIIRSSYTGLVNVKGVVDGAEILGLKPNLPQPKAGEVKKLTDEIVKSPRNANSYLDLGKLYEKAGNIYDASLWYHKAFQYGLVDKPVKESLYDRFLSWGMYKQATDLYIDIDPYNPIYADDYFRGAMAARRLGHPNMWDLNYMLDMMANRATHTRSGDRRGVLPIALRNLAEVRRGRKAQFAFMGNERSSWAKGSSREYILIKNINESKKLFKNDVEPWRMMAEFHELKGEYPKAYQELKTGMKLKGFNDVDRGHLALYAARSGRLDEARQLALQALKTTSMWQTHYALGKYYLDKKAYREAADELNKALALNQWQYFCYKDYAIALKQLGQDEKAAEMTTFSMYIKKESEENGMRDINIEPRNP